MPDTPETRTPKNERTNEKKKGQKRARRLDVGDQTTEVKAGGDPGNRDGAGGGLRQY